MLNFHRHFTASTGRRIVVLRTESGLSIVAYERGTAQGKSPILEEVEEALRHPTVRELWA